MKKKAIQIYVTKEGKKAALRITKKAKKAYGTSEKQYEVISDFIIENEYSKERIKELELENAKLKLELKGSISHLAKLCKERRLSK